MTRQPKISSRRFTSHRSLGAFLMGPNAPKAFRVVTRQSGGRRYYQVILSRVRAK